LQLKPNLVARGTCFSWGLRGEANAGGSALSIRSALLVCLSRRADRSTLSAGSVIQHDAMRIPFGHLTTEPAPALARPAWEPSGAQVGSSGRRWGPPWWYKYRGQYRYGTTELGQDLVARPRDPTGIGLVLVWVGFGLVLFPSVAPPAPPGLPYIRPSVGTARPRIAHDRRGQLTWHDGRPRGTSDGRAATADRGPSTRAHLQPRSG